LEVLKEDECSMLLAKVEISSAHPLVENKIACHCTHVNSDASHCPPCKAKPKDY
jgi:hypothetical protein